MMIYHRGTKCTEDAEESDSGLTHTVIGAAIEVHRRLGPGLLESVYESAVCRELWLNGLEVERQVGPAIDYKGMRLPSGLRLDLLVNRRLIIEVKAVERLDPIHRAQLLTYLKLTRHRLGLLINFNVEVLQSGIRRIING